MSGSAGLVGEVGITIEVEMLLSIDIALAKSPEEISTCLG
jgi:hypothetical protein